MAKAQLLFLIFTVVAISVGCKHKAHIYISDCDKEAVFKKVSFAHLIDSAAFYNKKFVEVSGKYVEGKNISALVNDSLFIDRTKAQLWVNFTQDCPLFLSGTQQGLFSSEDGSFATLNNRRVTLRGRVEKNLKGYGSTINQVSYLKLY